MNASRSTVLVTIAFLIVTSSACTRLFGRDPIPVRSVLVEVEPAAVGVDKEAVRAVVEAPPVPGARPVASRSGRLVTVD